VSDLYERLLARVAAFTEDPPRCAGDRPWFCGGDDYDLAVAATRAVLELHKPLPVLLENLVCKSPDHPAEPWPCPTVRAIARALDVPIGDQQ
jgi:hypothetical protein